MGGLASSELSYKLDCRKALSVGTLPEAYLSKATPEVETLLRDYAATYLTEEIQSEALTRNLAGFSRYLLALAEHAGNILDLSKSAAKAKVSRTSAVRFIEILEDTLIAERIPSYPDAGEADVIRHPKLYFFDPGVLNGLLENFTVSADRIGRLMEHLVFNQLQNSLSAGDRRGTMHYFRTRNDVEVDFVVTLDNGDIWAIDVKSGAVAEEDIKPLLIFRDYLNPEQRRRLHLAAVSTRESQKRSKNGCMILGLNELMREMGI
jgi:predicted AAA+ superfamily ATPase